jgi:GT2 family glycosyltransferase
MIRIAVAVFDTRENGRTKYTKATYDGLIKTINPQTTRVYFIDNNSCEETKQFLSGVDPKFAEVITLNNNIGTAEAINKVIALRDPEDFVIKLDNDVVIHNYGWADDMARVINSIPYLGILALKRKDLPNSPESKEYPTVLETVFCSGLDEVVEWCDDVIGTCHMFNPRLLDEIGYLYQPGLYGFDDYLACKRSVVTGFRNAFYPKVEIDHIDVGGDKYTDWKRKYAGIFWTEINKFVSGYESGDISVYYEPNI